MELLFVFIFFAFIFAPPFYLAYFLIRKRVHLSTLIVVILVISGMLGLNLRHAQTGTIGWPLDADQFDSLACHVFAMVVNATVVSAPLLVIAEYLEHRNKRRRKDLAAPSDANRIE